MMLNMSFLPHGIIYLCTLSSETNRRFAWIYKYRFRYFNQDKISESKEERLNKLIIYLKLTEIISLYFNKIIVYINNVRNMI